GSGSETAFQEIDCLADFFDATALIVNFALDIYGAGVTGFLQCLHESRDSDGALSQWTLFAERAGVDRIRPIPVFGMHGNDVWSEHLQGLDRVAGSIENHVRRIEIDLEIAAAGVV